MPKSEIPIRITKNLKIDFNLKSSQNTKTFLKVSGLSLGKCLSYTEKCNFLKKSLFFWTYCEGLNFSHQRFEVRVSFLILNFNMSLINICKKKMGKKVALTVKMTRNIFFNFLNKFGIIFFFNFFSFFV